MEEAMIVDKVSRNVENLRILLQDAMPNGQFDVIKRLVSSDCVTRRAGFANLYAATGGSIPERGNFLEWVKAGWKPLSAALGDQHMEVEKAVGQGDSAMMHYHMRVRNKGEFLGMPATGNVIEWQEIAIASFDDDGTIIDLWFMCEELKLAEGLGFTLAR